MVLLNLIAEKKERKNLRITFSVTDKENGLRGEYSLSMPAERYCSLIQYSYDDCEQEPFENILLSDEAWKVLNPVFDGSFKEAQKKPFLLNMDNFDKLICFLAVAEEKEEISNQLKNGSSPEDCCTILKFVNFIQLRENTGDEVKVLALFRLSSDSSRTEDSILYGIVLTRENMRQNAEFALISDPKRSKQFAQTLLQLDFGLALIPEEWEFITDMLYAYHDPEVLPDGSCAYLVEKKDVEQIMVVFTGNFDESDKDNELFGIL